MSVCPYERCDLGNYKSYNTGMRHAYFLDSCAAHVCFVSVARPQTTQNCGSYSFNARTKILTQIYCFYQYISIDPKKVCHAHFNAHKLQKTVNMNADNAHNA